MRKEIIIYKTAKPERQEICSSIEHFCLDHCMDLKFLSKREPVRFRIDGDLYQTELSEEHQEEPSYWMIRCKCQPQTASGR